MTTNNFISGYKMTTSSQLHPHPVLGNLGNFGSIEASDGQ